ncbi:hypothetical protein B9Z55_020052 [Caenorhabditis nigoni]|uniref:Uncharacterized protein n=1 Tax=Caenorhabditis nigoni TaxID=1611254 RepID=A0A2G5TL35_9PELO|nr:hypothetical protein B9Z55_020052 [Caenorhabditis nigoni]
MQLVPFFPYIVGGCAAGLLLQLSLLSPHICMTILSFLVGFQVNTLNLCFLKKHQTIAQISGGRVLSKNVFNIIVFLLLAYPFTYSVPFQLAGKSKEEQYKLIDRVR